MSSSTPPPARPPTPPPTPPSTSGDPSLGTLVQQLSEQIPELIRSELKLAQAEVTEKGKRLGFGVGAFGAAGLVALFAFGTAVAAAILGLATAMPGWGAALVVTAVLILVAGLLTLVGRSEVTAAQPLTPEKAVSGIEEDIETLKGVRP